MIRHQSFFDRDQTGAVSNSIRSSCYIDITKFYNIPSDLQFHSNIYCYYQSSNPPFNLDRLLSQLWLARL